jgi:hypothetical protein
MRHMTFRPAILISAAATALPLAGCQGRALVPNVADGLRAEVVERTRERDDARAKAAELETKLAELTLARDAKLDPEAAEAMPALAGIGLSSLSTARLLDANKATLALVVEPRDGLGRFLQITGTLRATAVVLIPGRDPLSAGKATLGPKALREAYRSTAFGTHYTVEIPLTWEGSEPARSVSIAAEFTDALTGKAYPIQGTVAVVKIAGAETTTR